MNPNPMTYRSSWWLRVLGHHPLVRSTDRIEAFAKAAVVAMVLLALPFACALGTSVHDRSAADYTRRSSSQYELAATATDDSVRLLEPYQVRTRTPVRWIVDGEPHDDVVTSSESFKAGDRVTIWVDDRGNRVRALTPHWEPVIDAVCVALSLWLATIGLGLALLVVLCHQLRQRRFAMWERELNDLASDGGSRSGSW